MRSCRSTSTTRSPGQPGPCDSSSASPGSISSRAARPSSRSTSTPIGPPTLTRGWTASSRQARSSSSSAPPQRMNGLGSRSSSRVPPESSATTVGWTRPCGSSTAPHTRQGNRRTEMSTTEARTTLATVAASAGVSVATVSKVLNGRRDVAPATRARVQEMLRAHDYGGRLLTIERHPTVELTFRGKIGGYSSEIVQGVAATAAELGVAVTIGVKPVDQRPSAKIEAATWARNLAVNGRRAGIAVTDELGPHEISALARVRLPLVVIDPMNIPSPTVVSVGSTNFRGGQAAARHLVELGHRRVAYLGGRATAECSQARLGGFRSALESAGIVLPEDYVHSTEDFHYQNGLDGAPRLLSLAERP